MKRSRSLQITKNKTTARDVTKATKKVIRSFKMEINQYYDGSGFLSWSSKLHKYVILGTNSPKKSICPCPECNAGQLMVIKSPITKKKFIGCSNYYNGCKASSPLLQKAMVRVIKKKCTTCSWPTIVFRFSKKQKWQRQCASINCKSRKSIP
jgi:hypothetical protein|tara:strand:+ start:450 stop:905 length:456 start_codon:yes stop_codon:yes gene_type:complete